MTRLLTFPRLPNRARQVFSAIYAAPGSTLADLSRRVRLPLPRMSEIVQRLEWLDLIVVRKDTQRRCLPAMWTVSV